MTDDKYLTISSVSYKRDAYVSLFGQCNTPNGRPCTI